MTQDIPVHVDVEGPLIDWAPGALADVGHPGWTAADSLTGPKSIAIFQTGGVERNLVIDSPTIAVEVLGTKLSDGKAVILLLRALIKDLVGREGPAGIWITGYAEFGGPAILPKAGAENRYTMTISLDVGAVTLP